MSEKKESRRRFFQKTAASSIGLIVAPSLMVGDQKFSTDISPKIALKEEWRNKQSGMSYRMLGKTGLLVSEIIMGTFAYNDPSFFPVIDAGIERGMNYLDAASAYSQGKVEEVLGSYFKKSGNRDKVFLATKLSAYYNYIDGMINDTLKSLPQSKQNELKTKALELIEERRVLAPGYHVNYFGGQARQFDKTYLRHVVLNEYGYKKEWKNKIKTHARQLMDQSLHRLQTDHVDVLHIPHGVAMPEMMEDLLIKEIFDDFKQSGKIRFAAVSFHNDVTANLSKVIEAAYYDAAMFAYNIANHAGLETMVHRANKAGIGLIAMKVAKAIGMPGSPQWRLDKLNICIPDAGLSKHAKAYLWALQNNNLSCCVSQMETIDIIKDNASIVGKKVTLQTI